MKIPRTKIKGNGTSLWCQPDMSNKTFSVDTIEFNNFADTDEPYEIQVFGPRTHWYHYTDKGIQAEVVKKLWDYVQKHYPNHKIKYIGWSEQGMQPEKGWSFDVVPEKRASDDE